MKPKIPKALTIAGSDSGGGAGIQADLKTFSALGVHGSSIITAITAQNTKEVTAVHNIPIEMIKAQFDAVISDIGADSIKIGMLSNSEIIKAVAELVEKYKIKNIVLDPVMIAASGARLLEEGAIKALKIFLIPKSLIITPNIPEAEILAGKKINSAEDMESSAKKILKLGCKSVLLKGGHLKGKFVVDIFYDGKEFVKIKNRKLSIEGHGTGCTLSSAIAAFLAKGLDLENAVKKSIKYVHSSLKKGYKAGEKNFILNHSGKI